MSTETEIRARLVALVGAVANIGNVYDYFRYTDDWRQAKDTFGATISGSVVLRTWFVSCEAVLPEGQLSAGQFGLGNQTIYRFKIRGYFGLVDAAESEKSALALALAVQSALNDNALFIGIDAYTATLARLDPFGYATWGGALCHYAEITQDFYVMT